MKHIEVVDWGDSKPTRLRQTETFLSRCLHGEHAHGFAKWTPFNQSMVESDLAIRIPRHLKGRNNPLSEMLRDRLRVHYATSVGPQESRAASRRTTDPSSPHHIFRHAFISSFLAFRSPAT